MPTYDLQELKAWMETREAEAERRTDLYEREKRVEAREDACFQREQKLIGREVCVWIVAALTLFVWTMIYLLKGA